MIGYSRNFKLECLRLLATLRLNVAKMKLISGFVDSYLDLTADEEQIFQNEMGALASGEKETVMELTTSWERKGIVMGRHSGKKELLVRLLRRRFGDVSQEIEARIDALPDSRLDELGEAILDFTSLTDAQSWLDAHAN